MHSPAGSCDVDLTFCQKWALGVVLVMLVVLVVGILVGVEWLMLHYFKFDGIGALNSYFGAILSISGLIALLMGIRYPSWALFKVWGRPESFRCRFKAWV